MPASTTIASGHKSDVRVDNAGGTLTNVSGSTNQWSATMTNTNGKFFTFADSWQRVTDGGKSVSLNITALYSPTTDEGADLFLTWYATDPSGVRTVQIDYADASGAKRLTGEFAIDSATSGATAGQGGPAQVQATLASHGAPTITTTTT